MKIHVKIQGKTFTVKLGDIQTRPIQAEVDGEVFEVWPEEAIIPSQTSLSVTSTPQVSHPIAPIETSKQEVQKGGANKVPAPIPGVIVEITVKAGDKVKYGQELCVLEAMKMKNSIRASRDGIIKEICVSVGDHVAQSQTLIELEKGAE